MKPHLARALEKETRALYAKADRLFAATSCPATAECCQLAATRRPPWLYQSEWKILRGTLERQQRPLPPPRADGGCPFLDADGKRCTVYADRPLGCRTYFCRRGVGPARAPLAEMDGLLERLRVAHLVREGQEMPRSLIEWYEEDRGPACAEPEPRRRP